MARGSVNKAILIGNLGDAPEIRYLPSGQGVANFSIATNRTWTDREGNRQERTEWHNIVAWGKLAEICEKYLKKGDAVYIEGRIETRSWEDKSGQKRYTTEIVAQEMTMLGSPGGGSGSQGSGGRGRGGRSTEPAGEAPPPVQEEDDDIPF